jgi:hypothetical protein
LPSWPRFASKQNWHPRDRKGCAGNTHSAATSGMLVQVRTRPFAGGRWLRTCMGLFLSSSRFWFVGSSFPSPLRSGSRSARKGSRADNGVCRLAAGGEWIRTVSSAMPRNRQQRRRLHAGVNDDSSRRRNSSIGLPRPTTARMMPPRRRSIGSNSAEASKPLPISRGTGRSNPFPSSGESGSHSDLAVAGREARLSRRCPALG